MILADRFFKCNVTVVGENAVKTKANKGVYLKLSSRYCDYADSIPCLVSERLTGIVPTTIIDVSTWNIPSEMQKADPSFFEPKDIDLVLASNYVWDLLKSEKLSFSNGSATLHETDLGWIVTGSYDTFHSADNRSIFVNVAVQDQMRDVIEKFWSVEEVEEASVCSSEEQGVEEHSLNTYRRDANGRFIVQLPFEDTVAELGTNRNLALQKFVLLEKKLSQNPELKKQCSECIAEYEALGHCKISEENDSPEKQSFYLHHHAVLKPSSFSTKLRVVLDASAKSSDYSFNDVCFESRSYCPE